MITATFIYNNYDQITCLLDELPVILNRLMIEIRVDNTDVFESWHDQEQEYLKSLKKEPLTKTLQIEYYQKLINLLASE